MTSNIGVSSFIRIVQREKCVPLELKKSLLSTQLEWQDIGDVCRVLAISNVRDVDFLQKILSSTYEKNRHHHTACLSDKDNSNIFYPSASTICDILWAAGKLMKTQQHTNKQKKIDQSHSFPSGVSSASRTGTTTTSSSSSRTRAKNFDPFENILDKFIQRIYTNQKSLIINSTKVLSNIMWYCSKSESWSNLFIAKQNFFSPSILINQNEKVSISSFPLRDLASCLWSIANVNKKNFKEYEGRISMKESEREDVEEFLSFNYNEWRGLIQLILFELRKLEIDNVWLPDPQTIANIAWSIMVIFERSSEEQDQHHHQGEQKEEGQNKFNKFNHLLIVDLSNVYQQIINIILLEKTYGGLYQWCIDFQNRATLLWSFGKISFFMDFHKISSDCDLYNLDKLFQSLLCNNFSLQQKTQHYNSTKKMKNFYPHPFILPQHVSCVSHACLTTGYGSRIRSLHDIKTLSYTLFKRIRFDLIESPEQIISILHMAVILIQRIEMK